MRFGFLARFAAVLLLVAVATAGALSYVLARAHLEAVRRDVIASTVGQASAQLQPGLEAYRHDGLTQTTQSMLATEQRDIENFQEIVRGVRLYGPRGVALVPPKGVSQPELVARAISAQDVVQSRPFSRDGDRLTTAYVPLAASGSRGYLAVAAIDISLGQLRSQSADETRFVVVATLVACATIFISLLTLAIAAQRELDRRQRIADTTFLQTMEGIAAIVDQRDPYTAGHSKRVASYGVLLAERLRFSRTDVERIRAGALLHDLGKIGVPDAVLLKNGPLDHDERAVINLHPTIAREILAPVEAMEAIVPCVLHHHERWDGRGYPSGLAGEMIPQCARVIAIADAFDAMTTDRPYRAALALSEARKRLEEGAGVQWDKRYVEAMLQLIDGGTVVPVPSSLPEPFGQRRATAGRA